jgi:P27 family predicted phage terminase small subunit
MRGRRKPTALKIHDGDFIKNPQRQNRNEPMPEVAIPKIPSTLGAIGKTQWKRICAEMTELGVISRIERAAIERYCLAYQRERECELIVKKEGRFFTTLKGEKKEHPASRAGRDYSMQCIKMLIEFGMTPCARNKLNVKKPENKNTDEQLFFGNTGTDG